MSHSRSSVAKVSQSAIPEKPVPGIIQDGGSRPTFYFWFSVATVATTFIGFVPSFWGPMMHGAHVPSPSLAIHGYIFSLWPLYMVLQTWLVASGRTARHRDVGLIGIALATAMFIFGVMAAINQTQRAAAVGALEAGLTFMILPIAQILLFAILIVCAIVNVRRPEWHKRLLVVATAMLMEGPFGRFLTFFFIFHGKLPVPAGMPSPPPPVDSGFPQGLFDFFLLAPIIYDWRKRGRPHPAYLLGGGAVILMRLLRPALSVTTTWHAIASWIYSLAG